MTAEPLDRATSWRRNETDPVAPPRSAADLARVICQHRLLEPAREADVRRELERSWPHPEQLARELTDREWLTPFQTDYLLQGRAAELELGPYVLLGALGRGGMGRVFKARHRLTDRITAVKVMNGVLSAWPEAIARFRLEFEGLRRLRHPNVILAHEAGVEYFAMEYAPGCDLARVLASRGPLPAVEACEWVRQAALGLQHLHDHGLIHRDVKPSNLLLIRQTATVKVLDLGIARQAPLGADAPLSLTLPGSFLGTADYMPPEQAEAPHTVDGRADVYALGCTLYHLLTGRVPFPGGSLAEKLWRHRTEWPLPGDRRCPGVPPGLTAVLARMLAKDRANRYPTPSAVAEALQEWCGR